MSSKWKGKTFDDVEKLANDVYVDGHLASIENEAHPFSTRHIAGVQAKCDFYEGVVREMMDEPNLRRVSTSEAFDALTIDMFGPLFGNKEK